MIIVDLVRAVWRYRGFVAGSVQREFQMRYRNSLLGGAWIVLQPLAMILVYATVFSQIMRARLPGTDDSLGYTIYLCAGILSWGLFTEIMTRSLSVFVDNANMLKKLSFPRICLPVVVGLGALLNYAITISLFLLFLLACGRFPGMAVLALPALVALHLLFALSLGVILGVLNVFFRDIAQLFTLGLQLWFWFTPIVYHLSILPEKVQFLLSLNPMTGLMVAYQGIFLEGRLPDWSGLLPLAVFSLVLCAMALSLFRARSGEMVDEL